MTQDEKLKKIADHYGIEVQLIKLAEECAEYAASVHKYNVYLTMMENYHNQPYCESRIDKSQKDGLKELADVLVVTKQIEYLLEALPEKKNEIHQYMNEKIDRQLKRIEDEKNGKN